MRYAWVYPLPFDLFPIFLKRKEYQIPPLLLFFFVFFYLPNPQTMTRHVHAGRKMGAKWSMLIGATVPILFPPSPHFSTRINAVTRLIFLVFRVFS